MTGLRTAISFLTRVPVSRHEVTSEDLARAVAWFPLVGLLVGSASGLAYAAVASILPWTAAAVVALVVGALMTGAFHEDGLGDTADAFGGGWSADDVLRILKDSRQGTYGVLAIGAALLAKVSLLAVLGPWAGAVALVAAHVGGRAIAVALMAAGTPAPSSGGLGASYLSVLRHRDVAIALGSAVMLVAALLGLWTIATLVLGAVVVFGLERMARRRIGGLVGDVLGTAEQLGEVAILAVAASVVSRRWPGFELFEGPGWWAGLLGHAVWP